MSKHASLIFAKGFPLRVVTVGVAPLLFLCGEASAQQPGEKKPTVVNAQADEKAAAREMQTKWETLQKDLESAHPTPAERIRLVDEWQAREKETIAAAKAARHKAATEKAKNAPTMPPVAPMADPDADPRLVEADAIDAEIVEAIKSLEVQQSLPQERIRWVDDLLKLNTDLLKERVQLRREAALDHARRAAVRPGIAETPAKGKKRREVVVAEVEAILDAAAALPPEERIAAIDAKRERLLALQAELRTFDHESTSSTIRPPPTQ